MSRLSDLLCPWCNVALRVSEEDLPPEVPRYQCDHCRRLHGRIHGLYDFRRDKKQAAPPDPLRPGDFEPAFAAQVRGVPFKAALEELLLALDEIPADRLMQILGEGRGAWLPLLRVYGGELLFIGNSLSGSITPLCNAGFRVTVIDPSFERARFARFRDEAHSPGRTLNIVADHSKRLMFTDGAFDAVVQETGLPGRRSMFAHGAKELARVCRGEVLLIGDNRLGYKRSTGRRSILYVPTPTEYARAVIGPASGERTLLGYRHALSTPGFSRPRAFALYPHRNDFTHIVAIDEKTPELTVGPMEKKNRFKLIARSVGLFPVFTPSFALFSARDAIAAHPTRMQRILGEIAERTGDPVPEVEQIVATRGNSAVVHTALPGASEVHDPGRWTLHVPLSPKNTPQTGRHFESLRTLRARFPEVPVPEPLLFGRVDGVMLSCERRARGWTAPQHSGDHPRIARMLRDASAHFARLVVRPPAELTPEDFEREIGARIALVSRYASVPSTIENLARLSDAMRERLIGRKIARVFFHADLRAKHVQIDLDGRVLAYLDWGTAEDEALPYFDLVHLVVHERKQEARISAGDAWRIVRERNELRDFEREALDSYARAVEIDDDTVRAFEELYPVFVAAMAMKNWDFVRPRWLHRQFGM